MPQFAFEIDDELQNMVESIGSKLDEVAPKMLEAAAPILRDEIKARAPKSNVSHKHLVESVSIMKPKQVSNGGWIAYVNFKGKREDGERLMEVAAVNEYGRSNMSPQPFIKPAIRSCESEVNEKMKEVFMKEMGS